MALVPWPSAAKDAFVLDQFRLQHHHFTTHFSQADFWIVLEGAGPFAALIGRLYLDRSKPLWHVIDVGFLMQAQAKGSGTILLTWVQALAREGGAEGVELQVTTANPRAHTLYLRFGFRDDGPAQGYHQRMIWRCCAPNPGALN